MKSLLQRVSEAKVTVDHQVVGHIGSGLLILLGLEKGDEASQLEAHLQKIIRLRIFSDDAGKMNRSIQDISGECLVVSQFTLAGDCRKGTRPSFDRALPPDEAVILYERYVEQLRLMSGLKVETGQFAANMAVSLVNDGPVTFLIES